MVEDAPILFLDSGVGGLPYLESAAARLPHERFVYLADRCNFPYGEKSPDEVRRAVTAAAVAAVAAHRAKAVVVACNTASVVALSSLRRRLALPVVGVVPAVKPAAEYSRKRRIGVLATARTVEDRYLAELIARFAADCFVLRVAGGDIVSFVERRSFMSRGDERRAIVEDAAAQFRAADLDTVVLGCTHFLQVEPELTAALGPGIRVIDSREGVVRRLEAVLAENRLARAGGAGSNRGGGNARDNGVYGSLYVTEEPGSGAQGEDAYGLFAERYNLRYRGALAGYTA